MNTIDFDENRFFVQRLIELLYAQRFEDFQSVLLAHGMTLTDFIDATINALTPPPDLTQYFWAIQRYITTGELK